MLLCFKIRYLVANLVLTGLFSTACFCQTVAYTNATIETLGPEGQIENGTIIVQDDIILDVGADVKIPDDARVVSLANKTIMPGLIDPYFVFPIAGSGTTTGTPRTINIGGRTITIGGTTSTAPTSFTRIGEYFYPFKFDFKPSRRSGISVANLVSNGRGLSAFANFSDSTTPEMIFRAEGVLFVKATNQTSSLDAIRKPLTEKKKSTTTSNRTGRSSATSPPQRRNTATTKKSEDKTKPLWDSVREGKAPLFVNVNNAASVAHVLQVSNKHPKVRFVLVATGGNLFQSLEELKANKNVTVVLQPSIETVPYTSDLMNVSQMLADAEIPFAISMSLSASQMTAMQDDPMFPVAMLVKTGLDREAALKSITIKPAELMGIEKSHGSLEKNKKANFLVFDRDPLQSGSRLLQVILNGKKTDEN